MVCGGKHYYSQKRGAREGALFNVLITLLKKTKIGHVGGGGAIELVPASSFLPSVAFSDSAGLLIKMKGALQPFRAECLTARASERQRQADRQEGRLAGSAAAFLSSFPSSQSSGGEGRPGFKIGLKIF